MFRDRLPGHFEPLTQLAKRLAISALQPIQQLPAARIAEKPKHSIVIHAGNMEPCGCLMIGNLPVACQTKIFAPASTLAPRSGEPSRFEASRGSGFDL